MPSFHKAWARQDSASMSDKFRDTLKPQGALKPRIQNAVNKLQAQTSKMDSYVGKTRTTRSTIISNVSSQQFKIMIKVQALFYQTN